MQAAEQLEAPVLEPSKDRPRLSKTVAMNLLSECPAIAYLRHPRLGGQNRPDTEAMTEGRIMEAIICHDGTAQIEIVVADDWRTKAAREQRDAARAAGKIAILESDFEEYSTAASTIRQQIDLVCPAFQFSKFQVRIEWQSDGVDCAGVLDSLGFFEGQQTITDLKKCATVNPKSIIRDAVKYGWDVQHAAYLEAVDSLDKRLAGRSKFYFLAYQIAPIPMVQAFQLSGEFAAMGKRKWNYCKHVWRRCLSSGEWPGYYPGVCTIDPKPWQLAEADEFVITTELEDL